MKHLFAGAAACLLASAIGGAAMAGEYTDALGKCLVASSTGKDREVLVTWIFPAMAAHPSVAKLSSITAAEREAINRDAGAVFDRLVLKDCHKEAVIALSHDGSQAMESSFTTLGRIASADMFSDPHVGAVMGGLERFTDRQGWADLAKEGEAAGKH